MGAPRFFVGMFGTLFVVSVVMYLWTGSLFSAAVDVAVSAMLLQLGYFLFLLFLIAGSTKRHRFSAGGANRFRAKAPKQDKLL